jgi:hypothetical protein
MKKTARKLTLSRSALVSSMLLGALLAGQTVSAQILEEGREGERRLADRGRLVPTIPVILDGVEYPAGELPPSKFGRTFVLTPEDQENGVVHAFSSREVAKEFMRLQDLKSAPAGSVEALSSCAHPYFYSAFNKVRGGGGDDYIYMDMYRTLGPEIYFSLPGDWNNTISWVAAACNGWRTVLYSCRDFVMERTYGCADPDDMFISPGMIIPDLMPYGFNNRTSAIKFG